MLTIFRVWIPFENPITYFSYGMEAPYQGSDTENVDILAEGLDAAGQWHPIDLSYYFPVLRGEAVVRKYVMLFASPDTTQKHARAQQLGFDLLAREFARGHNYSSVRISWLSWAGDSAGYYANMRAPILKTEVLATAEQRE